MKCTYIILVITTILSSFSCAGHTEERPLSSELADLEKNYSNWVYSYENRVKALVNERQVNKLREQTKALWDVYKDSTRNVILKTEVVYIKRMASLSVMNSPAFYEKHYSGNTTTANGRGAENEDITMFYLSDGHTIKASPKDKPEWLGTKVGEKVLKTTGKKLKAKHQSAAYYPHLLDCCNQWNDHWITAAVAFKYENYITYKPLYSK